MLKVWQELNPKQADKVVEPGESSELRELVGVVSPLHQYLQNSRHVERHRDVVIQRRSVRGLCRPLNLLHFPKEVSQSGIRLLPDVPIRITEHAQQALEKLRQVLKHVDVWNRIQHSNPTDEKLSDVWVGHLQPLPQQRDKLLQVEVRRLGHNVLHQLIKEVGRVLNIRIHISRKFAQRVENVIEEAGKIVPGHLCHVVQSLAGVVAHSRVRVVKGS
mmetsp:Transcript_1736/g.2837  ORF Transcript_1736/g.2837 Transcript_1736/m.2837 type:complete len:217 (-) Transcript_1736:380-1030(-)